MRYRISRAQRVTKSQRYKVTTSQIHQLKICDLWPIIKKGQQGHKMYACVKMMYRRSARAFQLDIYTRRHTLRRAFSRKSIGFFPNSTAHPRKGIVDGMCGGLFYIYRKGPVQSHTHAHMHALTICTCTCKNTRTIQQAYTRHTFKRHANKHTATRTKKKAALRICRGVHARPIVNTCILNTECSSEINS